MCHKRRYLAQKDGGGLGGLPRLEIEQGGRAGAVASKASGEGGAEEGRGPPARADDAGPSAERKRRRRDNVAAAARLCDGACAEMVGGGGRPEEGDEQ